MRPKRKEKPEDEDLYKTSNEESDFKKDELEELRTEVDDLRNQKDELFAKLQRISADYSNYQKRAPKQIADTISYEKEKIIKTLLPALDNFEHTLQNAKSTENTDVLVKGVQIIYDHILDILKSHGVEQIKALGEKFNPSFHEAMMQKEEPEKEDNIVLEEFQKGYRLNGRVIRPSKVIVNKLPIEQQEQTDNEYEIFEEE
jgi:molecular chaperone GrpE